MNFRDRSYEKELLDRDDIPFAGIRQNMKELNVINKKLGGHRITIKGFNSLLNKKKETHVCEIGCGGGDNLFALQQWCKKVKVKVHFTGIDIKQACIDFATSNTNIQACTNWIVSDYKDVQFTQKPDIIFSSLFCHHFTNEELVKQVQWMQQNSATGFFINDLQRNRLAYHSIKLLTRFFSKSYLVKHDAPLSVARSFLSSDWEKIFLTAGIKNYQIKWEWAFRYLITYQHERREKI